MLYSNNDYGSKGKSQVKKKTGANVKYYYTHYPNHPLVQRLQELFPLNSSQKSSKKMAREESIKFIIKRVKELGYIPGPSEDRALYQKVKYFYKNYPDNPGIESLMAQYPLVRKKSPSMFLGMTFDQKVDYLESFLIKYQRIPPIFLDNRITANVLRLYERYPSEPKVRRLMMLYPSNEVYNRLISEYGTIVNYMKACIEHYSQLPGDDSIPMYELSRTCRASKYNPNFSNGEPNLAVLFVKEIAESNFRSERINKIYELIKKD